MDSGTQGDLLDLASALRQLLVEGLVHKANRRFKLRVTFRTPESNDVLLGPLLEIPDLFMSMSGDPTGDGPEVDLSLQDYRHHKVLFLQGQWYSVDDIIKVCANKLGGVHLPDPVRDSAEDAALRALNNSFDMGGAPAVFRLLLSIGRVTRVALAPLNAAITHGSS
jgi:hypothetical protein